MKIPCTMRTRVSPSAPDQNKYIPTSEDILPKVFDNTHLSISQISGKKYIPCIIPVCSLMTTSGTSLSFDNLLSQGGIAVAIILAIAVLIIAIAKLIEVLVPAIINGRKS